MNYDSNMEYSDKEHDLYCFEVHSIEDEVEALESNHTASNKDLMKMMERISQQCDEIKSMKQNQYNLQEMVVKNNLNSKTWRSDCGA